MVVTVNSPNSLVCIFLFFLHWCGSTWSDANLLNWIELNWILHSILNPVLSDVLCSWWPYLIIDYWFNNLNWNFLSSSLSAQVYLICVIVEQSSLLLCNFPLNPIWIGDHCFFLWRNAVTYLRMWIIIFYISGCNFWYFSIFAHLVS